MTINYVLRGGRRWRVGSGSLRNSLSDLFAGELGPLEVGAWDPFAEEIGDRCAFVVASTGSWLTRIGERKWSAVELLNNKEKEQLKLVMISFSN
jgi:hypothetical protein